MSINKKSKIRSSSAWVLGGLTFAAALTANGADNENLVDHLNIEKEQQADSIFELINNGALKIDPATGKAKVVRPVLEILEERGLLIRKTAKEGSECDGWGPR